MRTIISIAALAAVCVSFGIATPQAQAQGTNVVVIDVPHIFKNLEAFKSQIAVIKKDIDAYKEFVTAKQKELRDMAMKLEQYKAGSPEYKQLEEETARKELELRLEGSKRQKEFMEREARVYYDSYQQVEQAVAEFCSVNGIKLVLRYSGEEMDPAQRESIMQGINRFVVYQNQLDITQHILVRLNAATQATGVRQTGAQAPLTANPTIPRPVQ